MRREYVVDQDVLASSANSVYALVSVTDQRRAHRFELELPFELVRSKGAQVSVRGFTRNLSSAGVLFQSRTNVDVGDPVEFLITFPTENGHSPVLLHCVGKVVRSVDSSEYAATVERYEFIRQSAA